MLTADLPIEHDDHSYAKFDLVDDWIGVDFDGTVHDRTLGSPIDGELGPPVELMLTRIRNWRKRGMTVKILTARVSTRPAKGLTAEEGIAYAERQQELLDTWFLKYLGETLELTCSKDTHMYQLWDDRAVSVERNTGQILGRNPEW